MHIYIFAVVAIVVCVVIIYIILRKRRQVTYAEFADVIERFIEGKTSPWEWDDLLCSSFEDEKLEMIRLRCVYVREEFPPTKPGEYTNSEGLEVLRRCAEQLRGKYSQNS